MHALTDIDRNRIRYLKRGFFSSAILISLRPKTLQT